MRKFLFALITLVTAVAVISCTDDNIGTSTSGIKSAVIIDSNFVFTGKTVRNNHLRSRSSIQLLGEVDAPGYGSLTSDVVAQFMPTTSIDTMGVDGGDQWIDSCFITMRVKKGDFTGDSLAPMRMNIYKLNKQLPNPIYTDFDPTGYYNRSDLLGSITYAANDLERAQSIDPETGLTYTYYEMKVPVPVEVARDMFNRYDQTPEIFSSPTTFAEYFPGIYITNSYGRGNVMNFYDIEFETYYRKHVDLGNDNDTIYPAYSQSYLAVTPEVVYNNNITLTPASSITSMIADGDAIVMGPAGYEVEAMFPVQDLIDHFRQDSKDALSVINTVSLEIPVEMVANTYGIAPPDYLLMVKENYRDTFFEKDSLTNNKDAFYAAYNSLTRSYSFTGMRDYVLDIINNKGGIADESDMKFIIMPIDVTKFTTSSSSNYYYYYYGYSSGTTEVVTKIAPAISVPSLAKLNLNKAKIALTYSKQSIY